MQRADSRGRYYLPDRPVPIFPDEAPPPIDRRRGRARSRAASVSASPRTIASCAADLLRTRPAENPTPAGFLSPAANREFVLLGEDLVRVPRRRDAHQRPPRRLLARGADPPGPTLGRDPPGKKSKVTAPAMIRKTPGLCYGAGPSPRGSVSLKISAERFVKCRTRNSSSYDPGALATELIDS